MANPPSTVADGVSERSLTSLRAPVRRVLRWPGTYLVALVAVLAMLGSCAGERPTLGSLPPSVPSTSATTTEAETTTTTAAETTTTTAAPTTTEGGSGGGSGGSGGGGGTGGTVTLGSDSLNQPFRVTTCSTPDESSITLTATSTADPINLSIDASAGSGSMSIAGTANGNPVSVAGTVTSVTVGDAGNVTVDGTFTTDPYSGDAYTISGSCA